MRTVAITGTRNTRHRGLAEYATLFGDYLGPFAAGAHFFIGGAVGIDSYSLMWLAEHTQARITVVAPGVVSQQPDEARRAIIRARARISEVVELRAAHLAAAAYHARNRWMVDHAQMTIGFPHGTDPSSGTWHTLDYTASQGKPRLIVPV